ncbi:MAG: alanyl-tRNA editing protein [Pseudomonadota bacterium]
MTKPLFRDDAYLTSCTAEISSVTGNAVILDQTVFYPMGGGQPGDRGHLILEDGRRLVVSDTRKGDSPDEIVHLLDGEMGDLQPGTSVTAEIDWERRHRLMRMHSCMHLLCSVIVGDVTGGQVGDGKGRLDFNLPDTQLDKEAIGQAINRLIEEDHPVSAEWISEEELSAKPELVRTMSVQPPMGSGQVRLLNIQGVDLQPCGGTHVSRTGEIGPIKVGKIENKGRQNRRVNLLFAD